MAADRRRSGMEERLGRVRFVSLRKFDRVPACCVGSAQRMEVWSYQRVYAQGWIAAPVCIEKDWSEDPAMTQVSPPVAPTPGRSGRIASEVVAERLSAGPGSIAECLEK